MSDPAGVRDCQHWHHLFGPHHRSHDRDSGIGGFRHYSGAAPVGPARTKSSSGQGFRVPGLLVYRFAGPLFFFNAAYFSDRIQEIVETTEPPVNFLLINAEAIVDMDINAVEMLEELHNFLNRRNIILGICGVKGHFRDVLINTRLTRRTGFKLYHSVGAVVQELIKGKPAEDNTSESEFPSS